LPIAPFAGQPLLAGFEELLRPAVIEVLDDPFPAAELSDALLAAQTLQHNADLVLGRKMPPGRTTDILDHLFRRRSHGPDLSLIFAPSKGYDEPEIRPYSICQFCLIGADAGQAVHYPQVGS
jgi:hypothetical protein